MLFKRLCSAEIKLVSRTDSTKFTETINIENLRISFQVKKYQAFSTNTSQIRVWNLSDSKRNAIRDFGDQFSLFAGYEYDAGLQNIFLGNTTFVSHKFSQPEIISIFECNSGERLVANQRITIQMKENSSVEDVIINIAKTANIKYSIQVTIPSLVYQKAFCQSGSVKSMLDKVCDKASLAWTVINNVLVILPRFTAIEKDVIEINENNGLIGYPERLIYRDRWIANGGYKPGYIVKTAMMPYIEPCQPIRLKSRIPNIDQLFFPISVTHTGDTHGETWQTQLELVELGVNK